MSSITQIAHAHACCLCCMTTAQLLILESHMLLTAEMLELGLAFPRANIGINKAARLFCNGFGLHPDHILQQLSTSISYFEQETAAI